MTASPVRDALAAFERTEARRKARMAHWRRVDTALYLAALGVLAALVATGQAWLTYVFVGLMAPAVLLPKGVTWPVLFGWVRRNGRS